MIEAYIVTDNHDRIIASVLDAQYTSVGMQSVELPDDFDFSMQSDYVYKNGQIAYDGSYTKEIESVKAQNELRTLQMEQLFVLASILVESNAKNLTNEQAFKVSAFFKEYEVGVFYEKDDIIRYNGDIYRIGQDHTSQQNFVPGEEETRSLYSKIEITDSGYEVWKEYDGVSGIYSKGQIVQDPSDGNLYKSLIDSNVWGPPSEYLTYWELQS